MIDADPVLRAAWNGFTGQLAKDAALIADGVQPTGQAIATAALAVHEAVGTDQAGSD